MGLFDTMAGDEQSGLGELGDSWVSAPGRG
jgi:hypothetical protein